MDYDVFVMKQTTHETQLDTPVGSSYTSTTDTSSDSLSEHELSWDSSPEQTMLQQYDNSPDIEQPTPLLPRQPPPRRLAVSDNCLARSHAFRCPPDAPRPSFPAPGSLPTLHFYRSQRSRIPRPTSPSAVDTNLVNDISNVPIDISPPPAPYKLRRRRDQPSDYQVFDKTGRK